MSFANAALVIDIVKFAVLSILGVLFFIVRFRGIYGYTYKVSLRVFLAQISYIVTVVVGTFLALVIFHVGRFCDSAIKISLYVFNFIVPEEKPIGNDITAVLSAAPLHAINALQNTAWGSLTLTQP